MENDRVPFIRARRKGHGGRTRERLRDGKRPLLTTRARARYNTRTGFIPGVPFVFRRFSFLFTNIRRAYGWEYRRVGQRIAFSFVSRGSSLSVVRVSLLS